MVTTKKATERQRQKGKAKGKRGKKKGDVHGGGGFFFFFSWWDEAGERPNTLGEDPIEEYRPLPVFVSDQIGGWLLVVSLEYILIPGDPSRGTFAE